MRLGYNTNGFAHHRLGDAVAILADMGYQSVAVTLEHTHLDPPAPSGALECVAAIKAALGDHGLSVTVETGARFILDAQRKHQPTLISAAPNDRQRRIEFIEAAIDVARELGADSVSLWSGAADDEAPVETLLARLVDALKPLLEHAESSGVRLGFEPEPGMFVDSMDRFGQLFERLGHTRFGLTLDVGHVCCMGDGDVCEHIRRWRHRLWNVHIEDMRPGVHEHLMFGEGSVNFAEVFSALDGIDYAGPVHVELSRHGHMAVEAARRSYAFLAPYLQRP